MTEPKKFGTGGRLAEAHAQNEGKRIDLGFMGKAFGSATEKPGNIAGLVIVVALLLLALVLSGPENEHLPKKDATIILSNFITLALGYLFGSRPS